MRKAVPRCVTIIAIGLAILTAPTFGQSNSDKIVLITEKEAALPVASVADLTFRAGITRGPQVVLVAPPGNDNSTHSPVHIQFRFEAHGGAKIDPKSIKITYLKDPPVDLTERVRSFMGPNGIDVPAAGMPTGKHPIRVELKDTDGRSGAAYFTLKISP
jgi:hypothetical protein